MFRAIASTVMRQTSAVAHRGTALPQASRPFSVLQNNALYGKTASAESDEEFDQRYIGYFNNPNIDGWEIRKHMQDLHAMDMVAEPSVICAALKACRHVNDYALAVRILEAIHFKCGPAKKTIWPYIVQEIKPTCEELGILLPEEMGYDKPELWLENTDDM